MEGRNCSIFLKSICATGTTIVCEEERVTHRANPNFTLVPFLPPLIMLTASVGMEICAVVSMSPAVKLARSCGPLGNTMSDALAGSTI